MADSGTAGIGFADGLSCDGQLHVTAIGGVGSDEEDWHGGTATGGIDRISGGIDDGQLILDDSGGGVDRNILNGELRRAAAIAEIDGAGASGAACLGGDFSPSAGGGAVPEIIGRAGGSIGVHGEVGSAGGG